MKFRFIIRKFIEAENIEQCLKQERRTKVHEVYLDNEVWKNREYALKDEFNKRIGYADKQRKKRN